MLYDVLVISDLPIQCIDICIHPFFISVCQHVPQNETDRGFEPLQILGVRKEPVALTRVPSENQGIILFVHKPCTMLAHVCPTMTKGSK